MKFNKKIITNLVKLGRSALETAVAVKAKEPLRIIQATTNLGENIYDTIKAYKDFFTWKADNKLEDCLTGFGDILYNLIQTRTNIKITDYDTFPYNSDNQIKVSKVGDYELYFYQYKTNTNFKYLLAKNDREALKIFQEALKTCASNRCLELVVSPLGKVQLRDNIRDREEVFVSPKEEEKNSRIIERRFSDKDNQSILMYGPPGTGKSTMALRIADKLQVQTLLIKTNTLATIVNHDYPLQHLSLLLGTQMIILDDLDRMDKHVLSNALSIMETLNRTIPIIIGTINHIKCLPAAMVRPGRFNQIIEVGLPNQEERETILKKYCEFRGTRISDHNITRVAEVAESLSGAYLKQISKDLTILDVDQTIDHIKNTKRIMQLHKEKDEEN